MKQGGVFAIRNPLESAPRLHQASVEATEVWVTSLESGDDFNSALHKATVRKADVKAQKERLDGLDGEKEALKAMGADTGRKVEKRLNRTSDTGAWLTVVPNRFDGTELSVEEFPDKLRIRQGMRPKRLPNGCDDCGFTIERGLNCKKGGLVGPQHNDTRDELEHLCQLARRTASRVSSEPFVFHGRGIRASQHSQADEEEGGLGDEA